MQIVTDSIDLRELQRLAESTFGNLVKAVVDVDRRLIALDSDMHSDLEQLLLTHGSKQESLWGINLYPSLPGDELVEFDSMINVRPSRGNLSRSVDNALTRQRILEIVGVRIRS